MVDIPRFAPIRKRRNGQSESILFAVFGPSGGMWPNGANTARCRKTPLGRLLEMRRHGWNTRKLRIQEI